MAFHDSILPTTFGSTRQCRRRQMTYYQGKQRAWLSSSILQDVVGVVNSENGSSQHGVAWGTRNDVRSGCLAGLRPLYNRCIPVPPCAVRSEERRVGKECRSR